MALLRILLILPCVLAASLVQITNFGTNPTNVGMYVYKPDTLPASPALLVANHPCGGTGPGYYQQTQYANLANTYGYIVLYGSAPVGNCWDIYTPATLTHDGGGDSLGVASAIRYAIKTWNVDPKRVFATGFSSGAMFTDVLLGAYPDLLAGGAPFAGVPFACFAGGGPRNDECANGRIQKTGAQWGDLVRAAYPGYTGPRPKVLLWHGTADNVLVYQNFKEEIKQWTNVLGYSETPISTQSNNPTSGITKTTYGTGNIVAYSAQGVGHQIVPLENEVLDFFGLKTGSTTPPPTTSGPSNPGTTTQPPPPTTGGAAQYAQCGGAGWNGPTTCASPFKCVAANQWYSQCL